MSRVVEHLNTASNGPVGFEYLLPCESSRFDGWLSQFVGMSEFDVASTVYETWYSTNRCVNAIAAGLKSFRPRSLYHLPCEWSSNTDWLLFENEHHVMYVPPPSELAMDFTIQGEVGKVLGLIRDFDGYQFGYNPHPDDDFLRCDSGFQRLSDMKPIDTRDDEYLWENDVTVLGGFWFFTTSCGSRLYLRPSGSIARWNLGNYEIDEAFDSLDTFATAFIEQYVYGQPNERSPLFY